MTYIAQWSCFMLLGKRRTTDPINPRGKIMGSISEPRRIMGEVVIVPSIGLRPSSYRDRPHRVF